MDTVNVEAIRAECKAMPRAEFVELAVRAGLKQSTAEKFRNGHIEELGGFKLAALANELAKQKAGA